MFRPEIFAVAGGMIPVLASLETPDRVWFGLVFLADWLLDFGFEGVPPYFSSNCCVVLYFVAALSLSIVVSRCFCSAFTLTCIFVIR